MRSAIFSRNSPAHNNRTNLFASYPLARDYSNLPRTTSLQSRDREGAVSHSYRPLSNYSPNSAARCQRSSNKCRIASAKPA
jgi:hypothetical protein